MKKCFVSNYIFQFVLVALCLFSCSKEDDYSSPLKNLVISNQTVEADVSISEVSVNAENLRNMDVKSTENWCKANLSEKSIRLNLEPNKTYDDRSTTIILTDLQDGTSTSFMVTQKMNVAIIIGNYDTNVIPEEGGILTLDVQSNVDYQVSIPADLDWIKVQSCPTRGLKESNVNLAIAPNNSGNVRTAEVKIADNSSKTSQSISIYQELTPRIQIDEDSISVDEYGGEIAIKVFSNIVSEIDNNVDWLDVGEKTDIDGFNFTQILNVAPLGESSEDRNADLAIRGRDFDTKSTLKVNQTRKFFIKEKNVEISTGETYQITLFNTTGQEVTWNSSDPSIVSVDNNGFLKGGHAGTCTITATTDDSRYSSSIEASVSVVFKLGITGTITLDTNESKLITIENNTGQDVVWKSSDSSVVSVDDKGILKGGNAGSCTITATTADSKNSASIEVNVPQVFYIESISTIKLKLGESKFITLRNNTGQDVVWKSSNTNVARVDNNGNVFAVDYGDATITVSTINGNCSDSFFVNVVAAFKIENPVSDLYIGELTILSVINDTGQKVSWHSSDTSVITVDQNGIIKSVGLGSATITVTSSDGRFKDECTIEVNNINDELSHKCEHHFYGTSSPHGSLREDVVTCRLYNNSRIGILLSKCTAYKNGVLLKTKMIGKTLKNNDSYEVEFTIPSDISGSYKFVWEYSLPPTQLTYECVFQL